MKIFISWSGERSKQVADLMGEWIRCVIQASRPWVSTQNIDRGALWFNEIQNQLQDTAIGIVCLTKENKNKPWILFECGALIKGLTASRVCTLLIDLQPSDVLDPLAQFNHTSPMKQDMWKLIKTLNNCVPSENRLPDATLENAFITYWPKFESPFSEILKSTETPTEDPPRSDSDILSEILNTVRNLSTRITRLELPPPPSNDLTHKQISEDFDRIFNVTNNTSSLHEDVLNREREISAFKNAGFKVVRHKNGKISLSPSISDEENQ
ncbi:toll/interleukin-1 receptor domain-containing protein [Burkholderia gladioli]|uniref:toll/interleukin-1 receptor domain-containing protein n=1 Tax=Burkholderia gladioli TaxID=28095 RepID=UPI001C26D31F|nr:toll/interleukin-1 receptor domain-containing protein [Burkholderia gladioli]MBU9382121.1 toll/interleukin-1 receptor domain-containing protein [Burkholderia gladioli]